MIKWLTKHGEPADPAAARRLTLGARLAAEAARLVAAVVVVSLGVEPECQRAVVEALGAVVTAPFALR